MFGLLKKKPKGIRQDRSYHEVTDKCHFYSVPKRGNCPRHTLRYRNSKDLKSIKRSLSGTYGTVEDTKPIYKKKVPRPNYGHFYKPVYFEIGIDERWLDLGAGVGGFASQCLRAGAEYYGIEYDLETFQFLSRNVVGGGNMRAQCSFASVAGQVVSSVKHDCTMIPPAVLKGLVPSSVPGFTPAAYWDGIKCTLGGGEKYMIDNDCFPPCKKLVIECSTKDISLEDHDRRVNKLRERFHVLEVPNKNNTVMLYCYSRGFYSDVDEPI